jgi:hypothetical protein
MGVTYVSKTAIESNFLPTGLAGDAIGATANGTSHDRNTIDKLPAGPFDEAFLLLHLEAINGGPSVASVTFRIEHSDNNSDWTAVTDLATVEAATITLTAVGFKTLAVRPNGLKRYRRAVISAITLTGGSSPSLKLRAVWVLTGGRQV